MENKKGVLCIVERIAVLENIYVFHPFGLRLNKCYYILPLQSSQICWYNTIQC